MRLLGIDFGTSNTVAMIRTVAGGDAGRARPLLFDGSPLLPSAVYLAPDGRLLVGRDAQRSARVDPARFEPNPKRRIDDGAVLLGPAELPVPQVIAAVLGLAAAEAGRQLGGCDELRLTHPARWGDRRRLVLAEAARAAGLPPPVLIAEPVAAASYYTAVLGSAVPVGRALAVYDLGGGTFDAAVVRRTAGGFEVLAEQGLADLGGLDFDQALVEHLGRGYADTRTTQWRGVIAPGDVAQRRQRALLYEDVRGAKEMLSRTTRADVHLPALEIDAHVTREELEGLIRPYLAQTVACLRAAIAAAGTAPADLVGIFLVGGSSRIPLAAHLIHTELGVAPTTLEQPETVVAEGSLYLGTVAPGPAAGHSGVPRPVAPPAHPPGPVHVPPRPVPAHPAVVRHAGPTHQAAPSHQQVPRHQPGSHPHAPPPHVGPTHVGPAHAHGPAPMPVQAAPNRPVSGSPTPPLAGRSGPLPPIVTRPTGPPPAGRAWYEEPTVIWTIVVLVLVLVAFAVLIAAAA
jgi:molecular chaperone DnaK (HSP70)